MMQGFSASLDGDAFRQVARLVDVGAFQDRDMIGDHDWNARYIEALDKMERAASNRTR